MNKIGTRIAYSDAEIRIASPKNVFMLLFLPVWLAGWTFGGLAAFGEVVSGRSNEAWFLILWLCGWLVGELFVSYALLWGLFGFEVISAESGVLVIKRSIFGYGLPTQFAVEKISHLRASGFFATMMSLNFSMAYWGLSGGTVAFDYLNKTKRFGFSLIEKDANQLVAIMKDKFNL